MPIKLNGATSGSVELGVPDVVGSDVQNVLLPSTAGTLDRLERAGNILQVKETFINNPYSVAYSTNTYTDITNLNVSITPAATTSKVLVYVRINFELDDVNSHSVFFNLKRDSTFVGRPAAAGNRVRALHGTNQGYFAADANSTMDNSYFHYLDSPGTTSSVTYQVCFRTQNGAVMYVNRTKGDNDTVDFERITSSIMVMEVAG